MTVDIIGWSGDSGTQLVGRKTNQLLVTLNPQTYLPESEESYKLGGGYKWYYRIGVRNLGVRAAGSYRGYTLASGFVHKIEPLTQSTLALDIGYHDSKDDDEDNWKRGIHLFAVQFRLNRPGAPGWYDYPTTYATAVIGSGIVKLRGDQVERDVTLIEQLSKAPDYFTLFNP